MIKLKNKDIGDLGEITGGEYNDVDFIVEDNIKNQNKIKFDDKKCNIDNKVTLKFANQIENYLKYMGEYSIIPIVNANCINLKLPKSYEQLNNTILIAGKSLGKSTLLMSILADSNPKFFVKLDKKIFESELVQKGNEYFEDKVMVHDDLIAAFSGVSTKQRQQLTNFWTQLLSHYSYSRERHKIEAKCVCLFGIAIESFGKYRAELFESTFLDRFMMSQKNITKEELKEILKHKDKLKNKNIDFPKIKLPYFKRKKTIELGNDKNILDKRIELAMELNEQGIMSATRAQNYIDIFMMSNALLNGRSKVTYSDLMMYEKAHPYHLDVSLDKIEKDKALLRSFNTNPKLSDNERMNGLKMPRATYYKYKGDLKRKSLIE